MTRVLYTISTGKLLGEIQAKIIYVYVPMWVNAEICLHKKAEKYTKYKHQIINIKRVERGKGQSCTSG